MMQIKNYKPIILFFGLFILMNFDSGKSKVINQKSQNRQITLTIVFDNISYSRGLKTAWDFGCVI
jgi:hypothetical protein